MALTQTEWTTTSSNGFLVHECTITATTAENDAYTLKTPIALDPEKQWLLSMACTGATAPDASALPVDLWAGYQDDFVLSGDGANVVATHGYKVKQILDDCVSAVSGVHLFWVMDSNTTVADDVTYNAGVMANVKTPVAPYYAFSLNGGSTLAAVATVWKIIQKIN